MTSQDHQKSAETSSCPCLLKVIQRCRPPARHTCAYRRLDTRQYTLEGSELSTDRPAKRRRGDEHPESGMATLYASAETTWICRCFTSHISIVVADGGTVAMDTSESTPQSAIVERECEEWLEVLHPSSIIVSIVTSSALLPLGC